MHLRGEILHYVSAGTAVSGMLRNSVRSLLLIVLICSLASGQQEAQPQSPAPSHAAVAATPGSCWRCCRCNSTDSGNATAFVVQHAPQNSEVSPEGRFKQLVPLLQSLIWPLLVGVILIAGRKEFSGLINRVRTVKAGGVELEVGEPEEMAPLSTALPENEDVPLRVRLR